MSRRRIGGLAVIGLLAFALTALAGGVPLGGSSPTVTAQVQPGAPPPDPFPENPPTPTADELAQQLEYQARDMLEWLRVALGDDVPCGPVCSRDADFTNLVEGWLDQCFKIGPAEYRSLPQYEEPRLKAVVNRFAAACAALAAPDRSRSPVSDSPEWRAAAERAVEVLDASAQPRP